MSGMTGVMGTSQAISGLAQMASSYGQSSALKSKAAFERSAGDTNAQFANMQAADAIARGDRNAAMLMRNVRGVIGQQRAGYAGQGVDVNKGSAAAVQADTAALGAVDAQTIRNNAWREAFGYRVQALDYTSRANFSARADENLAGSTLLTGGMNALSSGMQSAYWFSKDGGGSKYDAAARYKSGELKGDWGQG